ncbi:histidine--tRNA ligase [Candidatus Shapirobacteria bacterium CG_4_8_14_3_um_filter_35_11]|uniref:Histidine--tRNA ligase n=1 Tax=Candidatus Shapirobacteria bacterium CG_4_8_14_3_um_filter_35_11 TaxID=1974874 RepID=A0A2M8GK44_9BACT|nr:MAG: histidine--tRNA ligase [Candidatus Shapirobacteria bacterium CG_4_8_14_3_um_filter_35_11]
MPEAMAVRNYVKNLLIDTFETFGFEPIETPTLEYSSVLMGKYGDEGDKLVYSFTDNGDRQIGMRYDLTVPTAKVLAMYSQTIPMPFKRYQIQPVWRAENTQKGRYREVLQCDIDTFGTNSPIADAEILAVINTVLQKLNFKTFTILINSRIVLNNILKACKITEDKNSILQSLDKFSKIGQDGVTKELIGKNIPKAKITVLFKYIKQAQPDEYLQNVINQLKILGVSKNNYQFDPTIVRGLDYYTGPIFETVVTKPKIGSITGGGRYDNLIKSLGGPDISAVGTTIGLDRIVDCITELNLLPNLPKTKTKVLFANFGDKTVNQSLKLITELRNNNIASSFYPDNDKLSKQFKYADSLGIPFVAMIGTDESKNNQVTLKNMATGEQKTINQSNLLAQFV